MVLGFAERAQGGEATGTATDADQEASAADPLHDHFVPDGSAEPWVGIGSGYAWYRASAAYSAGGIRPATVALRGFERVPLQVGLDLKDTRQGGAGPFAAVPIAHYGNTTASGSGLPDAADSVSQSITNVELHRWVLFGIQGSTFDQQ